MQGEQQERKEILRRTFLVGMSGFVVTGCVGGNGNGDGGNGENGDGDDEPPRTEGLGPVPEEYETAEDVSGQQRDPDSLLEYDDVNYQSQPVGDQRCDGCRYWIPDKNGDELGACSLVAGEIEANGWCSRYAPQT